MEERSRPPIGATSPAARSAFARTADAFEAVLAFIDRTARRLRKLSFLAMGAGALIWVTIATQVRAAREPSTLVLWAVVLLACPAVLLAFSVGLSHMKQVRERLRSLPQRVTERSTELRRLAGEARGAAQQSRFRSILSALRFWRTAAGARELLVALVPARLIFTPWVLFVTLFALIGSAVELVASPFVALWFLAAAL
jgi:hypothetical protein